MVIWYKDTLSNVYIDIYTMVIWYKDTLSNVYKPCWYGIKTLYLMFINCAGMV
jgi:hypothetical protein